MRGRRVAALGVLLALLVGCTAPAEPRALPASPLATASELPSTPRTTFRYGLREPASLLPGDAVDPDELVVVDALFDSLTAAGTGGGIVAAAATDWTPSEDGRVWTFRLRPGATFATPAGDPVTAADFVFAWSRAAAQGRAGYHLEEVEGYDAVRGGAAALLPGLSAPDPSTLVVRLTTPLAEFPAVAAHPALAPLPQAAFLADPAAFAERPSGNGPFATADWQHGDFLRVTRFSDWRNGDGPALDEVLFRFSDPETAYIAFQQDRYDYAPLPPGALAAARDEYGSSADGYRGPGVLDGRAPQLYFLGMNLGAPPFDRPEVRRALSLALDREAIAAAVREGNADPAARAVPAALPAARTGACAGCRHDPEQARRLFAEAGVDELELWINAGGGHEQVAALVAGQLAEVDVTLRTRSQSDAPFADYLERLRSGEAALFRFAWSLDELTLDDALRPLFASSLARADGAANYGGYAAADVDALLDRARATLDPDERRRLYEQAEDLALDRDQAIIPLLTFRHAAVVSDRFEGFALNPLGLPNLAEVRPAAPPEPEG